MELPLSPEIYNSLRSLYKSTKDKRVANYLNIVLLKHKEYSQVEIADILNLDENTICTWLNKFRESPDLVHYLEQNFKPYVGKQSYIELGRFVNLVKSTHFCEVKPLIAQMNKPYSVSGMTKLLKRVGFSYKAFVNLPAKLDVEKQAEFVAKYQKIEENLTPKCALFFMDAVHPQHNTHTGNAWLAKGEPTYMRSNSGRNRLNINGLYNLKNQDVIATFHKTINAQATMETLEELKKQYPTHDNLYIVADNARYYTAKVLKAYLTENPVFKIIHLPPYSPNLNLIERLWKFTRKNIINSNYCEKFETFTNNIKSFFNNIENYKEELSKFIGDKFHLFTAT
jgi:transposase